MLRSAEAEKHLEELGNARTEEANDEVGEATKSPRGLCLARYKFGTAETTRSVQVSKLNERLSRRNLLGHLRVQYSVGQTKQLANSLIAEKR